MYKVAKVVKVVDVYHRRSPLVQGGLESVGRVSSRNFILGGKLTDCVAVRPQQALPRAKPKNTGNLSS